MDALSILRNLTLGHRSNPDLQGDTRYSFARQNTSFSFIEIQHQLFDNIHNSSQFVLIRLCFVKYQTATHLVNIFKKLLNRFTYENKAYFTVNGNEKSKVSIDSNIVYYRSIGLGPLSYILRMAFLYSNLYLIL